MAKKGIKLLIYFYPDFTENEICQRKNEEEEFWNLKINDSARSFR